MSRNEILRDHSDVGCVEGVDILAERIRDL